MIPYNRVNRHIQLQLDMEIHWFVLFIDNSSQESVVDIHVPSHNDHPLEQMQQEVNEASENLEDRCESYIQNIFQNIFINLTCVLH